MCVSVISVLPLPSLFLAHSTSLTDFLYTQMLEGEHAPPYYLDLYSFANSAQEDTFNGALPVSDMQGA